MKKTIVILLIFISCSSTKEVNSIKSIIKKVEKIEKNIPVLEKEIISLENLYSFEFGNYATSFKDKSEIRKIEYNLSSWSYTSFNKDNIAELFRMRYREDLISIVGEIYLYENKPILIKEKITRDPALLMSPPKNIQTGEVRSYTQVINQDEESIIYIQNWDKSEIIIENLFGSFTKWDFKKDFYNDIIEEVKKPK